MPVGTFIDILVCKFNTDQKDIRCLGWIKLGKVFLDKKDG